MGRYVNYLMRSITAAYTIVQTDELVEVDATDGSVTVTLPTTINSKGRMIRISKIDSSANTVLIKAQSGETISTFTTVTLSYKSQSVEVVSNGKASGDWRLFSSQGYNLGNLQLAEGVIIQSQAGYQRSTFTSAVRTDKGFILNQTATTAITAVGNTIPRTSGGYISLKADAAYTLTSTPTIDETTAPGIGEMLIIQNQLDGSNNVTIQDNGTLAGSNLRLGASTRVLTPGDLIGLIYCSDFETSPKKGWCEMFFTVMT